jgi:FOG: TPR repeat
MSGAPVFFGEFLLGLVVARTDRSRRPHLTVASIGTLASDPAFTEVCSQYMPRLPDLNLLRSSAPAGDGRTSDGPAAGPRPPRVFISYAHEDDNGAHAQQVRSLGQVLRAERIDVRLDHIDAEVSRDWTAWMRQEIETADAILVIASPAYKRRAEGPEADLSAGVAFEARLLRNELAHAPAGRSHRVVPVLFPGTTSKDLPAFLWSLKPLVVDPITGTGVDTLLRRLAENPATVNRTEPDGQALRFVSLADQRRHAVQRAAALTRSEQAIEGHRRLASDNPLAYQHSFVIGLIDHSDRLAEAGQFSQALAYAREAVDVAENATQPDPAPLAMALSALSNHLAETGERQQALEAAERAVTIRQQLTTTDPITHTSDLARSLSNLSNRLADVGRHQQALSTINDAVGLCRQLAAADPSTYLPDLATMLNNRGDALRAADRPTDAVHAIDEAVSIWRQLAETDSDTAAPGLASTLLNLGAVLSQAGRHREALSAAEEAVTLFRHLAESSFSTFGSRLATALHNFGLRQAEAQRSTEALEAIDEAIAIQRRLVTTNADAVIPDLAQSLSAAAWLRTSQRENLEKAVEEANEAVDIFRQLAAQLPTAFTSGLQQALSVQAAALNELGRSDEVGRMRSPSPSTPMETLDIRIQTGSGDPEELQSLLHQLQEEPTLRGQARLGTQPAPETSAYSPALLQVALPGDTGLMSLTSALTTWLTSRRRRQPTTVTITTSDGLQITVNAERADEVRAALESLRGQSN